MKPNVRFKNSASAVPSGFTLVETLIAVGLAAMLLAIYASVLTSTVFLRRTQNDIQAAAFIQEEIDALRSLPFNELLNRLNGAFLGLALTRGPWQVVAAANPPSGTKVLALNTSQPSLNGETGLAVLPGDYRQDFLFVAKINVDPASPPGWGAGVAFRYRDAENHYRFRFSSGGIALDKVVQGTLSTVWSQSATYNTGTWYTLEVDATDQNITLKKNGSTLATVADYSFSKGDLALLTIGGAAAVFDDVGVNAGGSIKMWNFDDETAGVLPTDWQRLSYVDLPEGSASLTIADYNGDAGVKNVVVNVFWNEDGLKSRTGTTLISRP